MIIETIKPRDRDHWLTLRTMDITSTEASSLFSLSPYMTPFELWHRKKSGEITGFEPSDRMKWGTRLQDSIAAGIAEDQSWEIQKMDEYVRIPELRIGSSFDFAIRVDGVMEGLLEIKNVDALQFRDGWDTESEAMEAPAHIEIQVQHQLAVSGLKYAYIAALVGGNRIVLIKREPDTAIIEAIRERVTLFWESIEENQPPPPIFPADAEFVSKLYGFSEPGKVMNAESDDELMLMALEHKQISEKIRELDDRKDTLKAQMLMKIGDAEKVIGTGYSISAGIVGPARVEYDRAASRQFRPTWRKEKK